MSDTGIVGGGIVIWSQENMLQWHKKRRKKALGRTKGDRKVDGGESV